jgi:putative hydrolase of the HAD superfamily
MNASPQRPLVDLSHVRTWVFDLDNTLYPPATDLFGQVDGRITAWIADRYGIDGLSAQALQKYWYQRHGTSLKGMMQSEADLDAAHFLDFVHDIDHSAIEANPQLGEAIAALPGRKYILTNGSRRHAENIAGKLAVDHLFDDIFDIQAAAFTPKPERRAYEIFLDRFAVEPREAVMFEDLARNLEVPHALGMRTVLVVGAAPAADTRADWEKAAAQAAPWIDYVTDDLAGFLDEARRAAR